MQDIRSIFLSGVAESSDVLFAGVRSITRRLGFHASGAIDNLPGRSKATLWSLSGDLLVSRHEVAITYHGRARKSLMATSERMAIPDGRYTLGQLLCSLYKRGDQWVEELDDSRLKCTVNGRNANLFDAIAPGAQIRISSGTSIFEV